MRWRRTRFSDRIEDRRRSSRTAVGTGIGGLGLIVVLALALLTGQDPTQLIEQVAPASGGGEMAGQEFSPEEERLREHVSQVLADTEVTWDRIFREQVGGDYVEPTLVLYTGQVQSACGYASAAVGPFYCSNDAKMYIDLSFFSDMERRFDAPGDFAQAYVVAHEIGHHVQAQLGILQEVEAARRRSGGVEANRLMVRLELMADCLAGVWASNAVQANLVLDEEDIREGMGAASAVGDDRLQMQQRGYVVPDSFTHGSSEQRMTWFVQGLKTGSVEACNTFGE